MAAPNTLEKLLTERDVARRWKLLTVLARSSKAGV
jgi:hypothetical protein